MSMEASSGGASVGSSDRSGGATVGSSDRSGGNNVGNECRIEIDQIIDESNDQNEEFSEDEMKQFDSFKEASKAVNKTGQPAGNPKIQKVPYRLQDNDKLNYFEPKMFSFGPYSDYPDPSTLEMAKQIKVNLAAEFLQQNGVEKKYLYADIKKRIKEFKDRYDDDLTNNYKDKDHELAWMFLVDGCAILQFMYIAVDFREDPDTQFKILGIKTDYAVFLAQDLFLLENQLPYQLLRLIIRRAKHIMPHTKEDELRGTSKEEELLKSIYKFIIFYIRTIEEWHENKDEILEDLKHDHVHLLDLLRKKLIQPFRQIEEKPDLIKIIIDKTVVLFDKLKCNRKEVDRDRFSIPFRNIGKLREAGINLKRSKTCCVQDIGFGGGTLKLPCIILGESTATMFLNMLAYEMCPDFHNESEVSSYMYFMDKLIDRTQDVVELQENNILLNHLGSDEEVVKLFNGISTNLFPNLKYYEVKSKIDNYFENRGLIWLHKVCHDIHQYFKRRWSLLAFIGALIAVASSIIQTVITVLAYQADSNFKER